MKAIKTTGYALLSILTYCIVLAIKTVLLPYPNTPKANWSFITSDTVTEGDVGNGIMILLSFILQVLFLALGLTSLFWIVFTVTHLFISLRKLVSFWEQLINDKNLGL